MREVICHPLSLRTSTSRSIQPERLGFLADLEATMPDGDVRFQCAIRRWGDLERRSLEWASELCDQVLLDRGAADVYLAGRVDIEGIGREYVGDGLRASPFAAAV